MKSVNFYYLQYFCFGIVSTHLQKKSTIWVVYNILCKLNIDMLNKKAYLPPCLNIINYIKHTYGRKTNIHKNLDATYNVPCQTKYKKNRAVFHFRPIYKSKLE